MTPTSALHRRLREERGVALVEYALVVPLLVMLLFGILDFGRAFNYWIDETHLANEAARYAAVDRLPPDVTSLQDYVRDQATTSELRNGTGSVTQGLQICIDYSAGEDPGDPVTVEATATYQWLSILGLSALSTEIKGKSVMRLEAAREDVSPGCSS